MPKLKAIRSRLSPPKARLSKLATYEQERNRVRAQRPWRK